MESLPPVWRNQEFRAIPPATASHGPEAKFRNLQPASQPNPGICIVAPVNDANDEEIHQFPCLASENRNVHHKHMKDRASTPGIRSETPRRKAKDGHIKAPRSLRTTVTLSPESQEVVERFKSANGTSTSAAIDQIIQRSEPKPSRLKELNGFLVLSTPPHRPEDARHVTLEDIRRAEDELDRDYVEKVLNRNRTATGKRKAGARR